MSCTCQLFWNPSKVKGALTGFDFMLSSTGVHNISVFVEGSFKLINVVSKFGNRLILVLLLHCNYYIVYHKSQSTLCVSYHWHINFKRTSKKTIHPFCFRAPLGEPPTYASNRHMARRKTADSCGWCWIHSRTSAKEAVMGLLGRSYYKLGLRWT